MVIRYVTQMLAARLLRILGRHSNLTSKSYRRDWVYPMDIRDASHRSCVDQCATEIVVLELRHPIILYLEWHHVHTLHGRLVLDDGLSILRSFSVHLLNDRQRTELSTKKRRMVCWVSDLRQVAHRLHEYLYSPTLDPLILVQLVDLGSQMVLHSIDAASSLVQIVWIRSGTVRVR